MKKKTKNILLDILGVFFLVWGIIAIANSMYMQNPRQILYLCYIGLLIIGIGILTKRSYLIMSQVYILAIPLLIWDIDFLHWVIFQTELWGITDYFFIGENSLIGKIVSLQHLFTIPLAIYIAKKIGIKRKDAWKWSFAQVTIIFIFAILFTSPEDNINCVFNPCINFYFNLPYSMTWYSITWFTLIFSMTFISSILINRYLLKIKNEV